MIHVSSVAVSAGKTGCGERDNGRAEGIERSSAIWGRKGLRSDAWRDNFATPSPDGQPCNDDCERAANPVKGPRKSAETKL